MESLNGQIKEIGEKQNDQDELNAVVLLNQAKIMKTQEAQDEAIANILLNQMGGCKTWNTVECTTQ